MRALTILLLSLALLHCSQQNNSTPSSQVHAKNFDAPAGSGLGFFPPDKVASTSVASAKGAILKIVIPTGAAVPANTVFKDPSQNVQQVYQGIKAEGAKATPADDLLALQLHRCMLQANQPCEVRMASLQMSAFATGDGHQIMTSLAAIYASLQNNFTADQMAQFDLNTLQQMDLDILGYDFSGVSVINEVSTMRLSKIALGVPGMWAASPSQDVAILTLTRDPIPTALKMAPAPPANGDSIYGAGYPAKTTDRAGQGAADSTGDGVLFTQGLVDTFANAYAATGQDWASLPSDAKLMLTTTSLSLKLDATNEMIGGPVLDDKGEYLGVLTSTSPDVTKKYSFALGSGNF